MPTRAAAEGDAALLSSGSFDEGRFLPGALLADRYRIISLIGRGGMGEVYRADDLKLGQAVALKFLPDAFSRDEARLTRLLNEVKVARQVAHPNVCRVYDIGEVDEQHFISMEHVDGEDLASLLRRIGRLPKDKAVQIARQICAGLAAAHDQGILHRDVKPANIMIDGRGGVRIMDFGLAGFSRELEGHDVSAGTPAYMAPEQLAGEAVSSRSDLYALGLVLYELFTGKQAFRAESLAELKRLREQSTPASPSSLVDGFDPAVEGVILRCLETDPRQRPPSAMAVAAALPGGDPLAAALAAGETPSPELVAQAGARGGLVPWVAGSCLAGTLLGTLLVAFMASSTYVSRMVPLEQSPEVLRQKAREVIERLGYTDAPTDSAHGFAPYAAYLGHVARTDDSPDRWNHLATDRWGAVRFFYRQSPRYLVRFAREFESIGPGDPPLFYSGEVMVFLDPQGRLLRLDAVPLQVDESEGPWPEPDWGLLFDEAGLDRDGFTPTQPTWSPDVYADSRMAWEGTYPESPDEPIRLEAAAYRGKPVYFRSLRVWSVPARMPPAAAGVLVRVGGIVRTVIFVLAMLAGVLVARRNLRLGRGDRKGAFRLALYLLANHLLAWLLGYHHVPTQQELSIFVVAFSVYGLFTAGMVWIYYLALEPYLRRLWPGLLVSWVRLLDGRLRDPLVGRDVLVGTGYGVVSVLLAQLYLTAPRLLGYAPPRPDAVIGSTLGGLNGVSGVVVRILDLNMVAITDVLLMLVLLLVLRLLIRRTWPAVALSWILATLVVAPAAGNPYLDLLYAGVAAALWYTVLFRVGLLSALVGYFASLVLTSFPLTLDLSAWYAGTSMLVLLIVTGLAVYGFYVSLAGRPIFADDVLQEETA